MYIEDNKYLFKSNKYVLNKLYTISSVNIASKRINNL